MTEEEFGDAYSRSFGGTVAFLVGRGVPYEAALDTAQDGWLRGWQCRHQLRDLAALPIWVNSIALNLYRTFLRSKESSSTVQFHHLTWLATPPIDTAPIDARRVMRVIPEPAERTLRQFYLEGNSVAELAHAWGCTATAARIRLLRARQLAKSRIRGKL